MTSRPDGDGPSGPVLSAQELMIAELLRRYIERRERGEEPYAQDLIAVASEHGDTAVDTLHVLLACYEAMHAGRVWSR